MLKRSIIVKTTCIATQKNMKILYYFKKLCCTLIKHIKYISFEGEYRSMILESSDQNNED